MASWLINVNATKYNILGSVREFGKKMPWHVEKGSPIKEKDIVFFYLTDSEVEQPNIEHGQRKYGKVNSLYKRFLFKGKVTKVTPERLDYDSEYWNDDDYQQQIEKQVESGNYKYVIIKITENLYDYKIGKKMVNEKNFPPCTLCPLDEKIVNKIQKKIEEKKSLGN